MSMFILWLGGNNVSRIQVLFSVLVAVMTLAFLTNYWQNAPPPAELASGFWPSSLEDSTLMRSTVAVLGAVVMPHNLFLHSGLVLKPDLDIRDHRAVREANKYCALDAALALFGCFVVNAAVVCSFAQNFHSSTCSGRVAGEWLSGACFEVRAGPRWDRCTWHLDAHLHRPR
eukprot:SRR837773.12204.p1 GENE.SRR837773.12204~~SRR837773.12204.p1  ORF type:complete len:199 (-),score=36.41 SRR837773.12204:653-1168(-)